MTADRPVDRVQILKYNAKAAERTGMFFMIAFESTQQAKEAEAELAAEQVRKE